MRLRPTVPIGMRVPVQDITVGGYPIPKGTTLMPFLDFRTGTEKYFGPEPDVFRPERFLGDSEEARLARSAIDRFGHGERSCLHSPLQFAGNYRKFTFAIVLAGQFGITKVMNIVLDIFVICIFESVLGRSALRAFSGGSARMCVGMTFAIAEIYAIVATVLPHHCISLADKNAPEPEMIYEAGVYQPKDKGQLFVLSKRLGPRATIK